MLCEACLYCEGEGFLISKKSICYNIYREIRQEGLGSLGVRLTLKVNPEIAELLHGEENRLIADLERTTGKQIVIYTNPGYHIEEFEIFESYHK
jgi:ribonuclease G